MSFSNLSRRKLLQTGVAAGGAFVAQPAFAQDTDEAPTTTRVVEDMILGDEAAPVTVIEYASLTCPHCASFHLQVFNQIKENYIETGKVKFIQRDVYFDRYGLWGSMVARCDKTKFFGIVDILFKRQAEWSRVENPQDAIAAIFAVGRQAGLTDEQMDACVQDRVWAEELVAEYQKNAEADDVQGTPTFMIDGVKEGNMPYNAFAAKLDAALAS